MAKRSRESIQKRAREKARQEKQADKLAKRLDSAEADATLARADEDLLMQEYARLSARYEADQISSREYDAERQRIFDALGLESDER
jgi:hypothetical protein